MNKSYRIKTNIGTNVNKHIKLKLEQEVSQFEILSLRIDQADVFQFFNCNHGVLIGRVIANGGVGIPNAKVSIFIPIEEDDLERPDIFAVYPYQNARDQNVDGKRYNLLPRVATIRTDGTTKPRQPFGSFPTKQEIVTNDTLLEVYEKYYKFSTVTNESGDYMLFGVPTGTQTVHMSVDITDIGRFSMTPQTLITNLGYSPNLFTDNGTRIKGSRDLDDLPNIETQEISVDIIPFCGDEENFDIGITRQDFRIRAELINTFTVFGSNFTVARDGRWNNLNASDNDEDNAEDVYRFFLGFDGYTTLNIPLEFRTGPVTERILYIPNTITDDDATSYNFDPQNDLVLLNEEEYTRYINDGEFVYLLPCNRKKIITSESGEDIEVNPDSPDGVFTEFFGIFLMEMSLDDVDVDPDIRQGGAVFEQIRRAKFRIPQAFDSNTFNQTIPESERVPNEYLGKFKIFEASKFYSISQFVGTMNERGDLNRTSGDIDQIEQLTNNIFLNVPSETEGLLPTAILDNLSVLSGEWLNLCLYFPQFALIQDNQGNEQIRLTPETYFVDPNRQNRNLFDTRLNQEPLGAGLINNADYIRADLHPIDFIEVPNTDILLMNDISNKGFRYNNANFTKEVRESTIKNTTSEFPPQDVRYRTLQVKGIAGSLSNIGFDFNETRYPSNTGTNPYFYKGLGNSDSLRLLLSLNLV